MNLRRLDVTALDALMALETRAQLLPWTRAALAEELEHGDSTVLGFGDLQGFVVVRRMLDEHWILNIAVAPELRKQGLGARLVDEARAVAAGAGGTSLWLEVRAGNDAARALYARTGFTLVGTRRGYYPPLPGGVGREDALVLRALVQA